MSAADRAHAPRVCDSCGVTEAEGIDFVTCREPELVDDEVYFYCEECYRP